MTTSAIDPDRADTVDVDEIARQALACTSVLGLGDEIASHIHGRRVPGVRVRDGVVRLHVVGRCDRTTEEICTEIILALRCLVADLTIDVAVIDMADPYSFGDGTAL